MNPLEREDLLYPELSYKIVGILFEVYNQLGSGYQEKYYQRAISSTFKRIGLSFEEQVPIIFNFDGKKEAKGLVDFIIEHKVILEIKKGERFFKSNIDQVYSYLQLSGLKLGILANFTKRGLEFKRIVNINS